MKYKVLTWGCQMNKLDSESIAGILESLGYKEAESIEFSDIIILNTCTVREKADQKVFSTLGKLKSLKKKNPNLKIIFCGCLAQRLKEKLFLRFPYIDAILGPRALKRFYEIFKLIENSEVKICDTYLYNNFFEITPSLIKRENKYTAWVKIMEGCNNFCSYCIVPYVRGREVSRPLERIIDEVKYLVDCGYKEVTLLGQNVNSYKDEKSNKDFPDLLYEVAKTGICRIRFVTSHPKDLSDKLISAMAEIDSICEHLHLPIQSGSNKILKLMNRRYTREDYLRKIEKLRNKIPNIALSTDIIVGFPYETSEDFEETKKLLEEVKYDSIFSFRYSIRPKTKAALYEDTVSEEEKIRRLEEIIALQKEISKKQNERLIGSIQEVLFDELAKKKHKGVVGRTRTNKVVAVEEDSAKIYLGKICKVKITGCSSYNLKGEIAKD